MAGLKLGEILVKQGLVKPEQMSKALDEQKKTNVRLSQILIQQGVVKDIQILKAVESAYAGVQRSCHGIDDPLHGGH